MRAQGILLVLSAILALLWIVSLDSGAEFEEVNEVSSAGAPESESVAPVVERPGLAPRPVSSNNADDDRDDETGTPAGYARAPERTTRVVRRPASVTLRGEVLDAGGAPVLKAWVYQLDKRTPKGTSRQGNALTESDETGRFQLAVLPLAGTWIGVKAFGHKTTFVDGDGLDPTIPLRIVLEDPLELRVVLLDAEGLALDGEGVRVMPTTNRGAPNPLPGPAANDQERFRITDKDGVVTFLFDRACPVVVIPEVEGAQVQPRHVWLPHPEGTVEFTTVPGVTLRIRRTAVGSASDVGGPAWATIHDETGHVVDHLALPYGEDGRARVELPLAEGRYTLQLSARHREPAVAPFVVTRGGQTIDLEVASEPLAKAARLALVLPATAKPATGTNGAAPLILVRRLDGAFDALGWRPVTPQEEGETARTYAVTLQPGTYEVAVLVPNTQTAAVIKTRLVPGEEARERVPLRRATVVDLGTVIPSDISVRSLRVEVPGLGWFPPVGRTLGALLRGEEDALNAWDHGRKAVLGPYPGRSVRLTVTDWRGRTHVFTVR